MCQPFIFDRPIDPDDLIDRQEELQTLLERLLGATNTRLTGPRDYGKTSLLLRLLSEAEKEGMIPIYVDLDGVYTKGQLVARVEDAYKQLTGPTRRIYTSLRRRGGSATVAGFGAGVGSDSSQDEVVVERRLRELLDLPKQIYQKQDLRCAVVFDEFQTVLEGKLDGVIRSVIQHHGRAVNYVFSGSHPGMMAALFSDQRRPFYGQAAPLVLQPLPSQELADYIAERFEQTNRDPGEPLEWLLDLVDGHPQRAMLLAHLLWSESPEGSTADEETWLRVLTNVWSYLREPFNALWAQFTSIERGVVEAISINRAGLSAKINRDQFELPTGSAAPRAAERLTSEGILVEDEYSPTRYRLVDPLFARWVALGRLWLSGENERIN